MTPARRHGDTSELADRLPGLRDLSVFLQGSWRVERSVLDRSRSLSGGFNGSIDFSPADGGLHYRETGLLSWSGSIAPATREYFLRRTGDPAGLDWYFVDPDGSPSYFFHRMDLRTGSWQTEHPCSADLYRVDYAVADQNTLSAVWDVSGPSKDQLLSSSWHRLG
ncbi:DUF6314 family protein [Arthrobacter russicus]|jgi:hypothetical protein|uniref:DUF6314 domain-containing protein n=1 Tax=Arthrobacter russicus TaxID=172040 RepID=A0ABU1JBI8_9MICC|nr:DUF6314 family protein [Arthrobacter russicus]MDR6269236.1 hypothetical protein [Arthrobacter russicus]